MAKYVCDFDQVIAAGDKLVSASTELETSISTYSTQITQDLSSWSGDAKGNFTAQCDGQVEKAKANAQAAKEAGEFIKSAAQAIQALESELAGLSI